jgi:PAB1-binding protein PBP1
MKSHISNSHIKILSNLVNLVTFSLFLDFQTDVDISKKTSINKKKLIQFTVNKEEDVYYGNLDDDMGNWDQFEINKQKFNVSTSYDEKHYTTHLNHDEIPRNIKIHAEKIAQEILDGDDKNQNIHIREERGLIAQADCDEEDRYSSVIRK